jgi:hypothetical protein
METIPFKKVSSIPSDCRKYEIREDQSGIEISGERSRAGDQRRKHLKQEPEDEPASIYIFGEDQI